MKVVKSAIIPTSCDLIKFNSNGKEKLITLVSGVVLEQNGTCKSIFMEKITYKDSNGNNKYAYRPFVFAGDKRDKFPVGKHVNVTLVYNDFGELLGCDLN